MNEENKRRSFWATETIRTPKISSGLAVMKSILLGYQIPITQATLYLASPFRTKEPTIIEIKEILKTVGFKLTHYEFPPDQFINQLDNPAIIQKKTADSNQTRWQLIWQKTGPFTQIMDPDKGRVWLKKKKFETSSFIHTQKTTPADYLTWSKTAHVQNNLRRRLSTLGITPSEIETVLINQQDNWQSAAILDASIRFLQTLSESKNLRQSTPRWHDLQKLIAIKNINELFNLLIPEPFWTLIPHKEEDGTVLYYHRKIDVLLIESAPIAEKNTKKSDTTPQKSLKEFFYHHWRTATSAPAEQLLWYYYAEDGIHITIALLISLFVVSAGFTIETFLLQGILNINQSLKTANQKILVQLAIICFFAALLIVNLQTETIGQTIGRRMEAKIRILFLEKIPNLGHQFFKHSRISDLTQRAYALRTIHNIPDLGLKFLQISFQLLFTIIGIVILEVRNLPLVLFSTIFTIFWFYYTQPILAQRATQLSLDGQSLNRIYLDALLGLTTIRVHSATQFIRQKHEQLMTTWAKSSLEFFDSSNMINTVGPIINTSVTILIMFNYMYQGGKPQNTLLLAFWALNIPRLSLQIATSFQDYLQKRTVLNMLLEPLLADDEIVYTNQPPDQKQPDQGIAIKFQNVSLIIDDSILFHPTNLSIKPNEHLAIVGPSGAGKSTLANLLLGWYQTSSGTIFLDHKELTKEDTYHLYRQTAWVDPSIQIWNHSLLYNLQYGSKEEAEHPIIKIIEQADLLSVLSILPDGMKTKVGEEGRLLSGGQAQRVRLGRAMLQSNIRLVILDEPFRGLDRDKRTELLKKARQFWAHATLICITHDVANTNDFSRVLVIENGRIIEDDTPTQLLANPLSRYNALIQAEEDVRYNLWQGTQWKRLWLENGDLTLQEKKND